jgi:hypothetical protein
MKDTRSNEIKKILKKEFPEAKVRVRIHKYSMGESIYVNTDLIEWVKVVDESNYTGFSQRKTEQSRDNESTIKDLLRSFERVDRDQWGDILSGGNTFLFIESL